MSICATEWHIPEVQKFLSDSLISGRSIWDELTSYLGISPAIKAENPVLYEMIKEPLKDALYATHFGMERRGISWNLNQNKCLRRFVRNSGTRFLAHPLIADMSMTSRCLYVIYP